jgi:hypothetical protein
MVGRSGQNSPVCLTFGLPTSRELTVMKGQQHIQIDACWNRPRSLKLRRYSRGPVDAPAGLKEAFQILLKEHLLRRTHVEMFVYP